METSHRIPELLAPAGGMEQLRAAVRFGADALYLAGSRFGMRARAANFSDEQLSEAIAFAHGAGVRVYASCNVLISQDDLEDLPAYLEMLQGCGIDALIIGDLGAMRLARRYAPDVSVHVSTQASVANAQAACTFYDLGAKRLCCAREMTLADIARMREGIPADMEIEAFVHGSMCMAVSGRCLISSYLTGRSGNEGNCTQPCRWSYALEEEKRPGEYFPIEEDDRGSFILNAKDLCMLPYLDELKQAGVDSIKIEGRNKKAFYVATVVNAYRQVLDGASPQAFLPELETVSHRPYSTGFYFDDPQQSPDVEGYTQECLHVADILACNFFAASKRYMVVVRCRNRFMEGDELEALMPRSSLATIVVNNLVWLRDISSDTPPDRAADMPCDGFTPADIAGSLHTKDGLESASVCVANRSSGIYCFETDTPLLPGGFLRKREFRASARHGD